MSIFHRPAHDEVSDTSLYELYSQLGSGDTPKLLEQSYKIDTDHDMPTGGGNSVDRKTKYIDRILYQEIMDGAFKATQLLPQQIVDRWLDHEHTEICLAHGDNAVDTYFPCHNRALKKEHLGVLTIRCPRSPKEAREFIDEYESAIWPGLMRCYHRPVLKPPKDWWCGPVLDQPTDRDKEILEDLRKLGVIDSIKHSKYEARYGFSEHECEDCTGWYPELISQEHGMIAACHRVSGLMRQDRGCQLFHARKDAV